VAPVVLVQPEQRIGRRKAGEGGAGPLVVGAVLGHPGRTVVGGEAAQKIQQVVHF